MIMDTLAAVALATEAPSAGVLSKVRLQAGEGII